MGVPNWNNDYFRVWSVFVCLNKALIDQKAFTSLKVSEQL